MFYLETALTQTIVGNLMGYSTKEAAVKAGAVIAADLDTPIDVVESRDADRIYPCGCSDKIYCDEHMEVRQ